MTVETVRHQRDVRYGNNEEVSRHYEILRAITVHSGVMNLIAS